MRALEISLAVLALRVLPARPPKAERRLVPAIDEPGSALLDRGAIGQDRAALIASLWPLPVRQCVVPARYDLLAAPAAFGETWLISRKPQAPAQAPVPLAQAA